MSAAKPFAAFSGFVLAVLSAQAQGAFVNLNFEEANSVPIVGSPYYPYALTPASALPSWSGSIGGVAVTQCVATIKNHHQRQLDLWRKSHSSFPTHPPLTA
jgi:hypothetical protein